MSVPPTSDADLWEIIMRLAEPADLLKSILNRSFHDASAPAGMVVGKQKIVSTNCFVINIAAPLAETPEDRQPAS